MNTKTVNLKTNYNNKLSANCFIHVDLAPEQCISETTMADTIFVITCLDGSFPSVRVMMEDLIRFDLKDAATSLTFPSHGKHSDEFKKWIKAKNPNLTDESKLAAYFYKKITD